MAGGLETFEEHISVASRDDRKLRYQKKLVYTIIREVLAIRKDVRRYLTQSRYSCCGTPMLERILVPRTVMMLDDFMSDLCCLGKVLLPRTKGAIPFTDQPPNWLVEPMWFRRLKVPMSGLTLRAFKRNETSKDFVLKKALVLYTKYLKYMCNTRLAPDDIFNFYSRSLYHRIKKRRRMENGDNNNSDNSVDGFGSSRGRSEYFDVSSSDGSSTGYSRRGRPTMYSVIAKELRINNDNC